MKAIKIQTVKIIIILALFLSTVLLVSCGQYGALSLPGNQQPNKNMNNKRQTYAHVIY